MRTAEPQYEPRSVVYFSKMYQAVPHLAAVQRELGGTFITTRRTTARAFRLHYPELAIATYRNKLRWLYPAYHALKNAGTVISGSTYPDVLTPLPGRKVLTFHGTYMALGRDQISNCRHFDLLCVIGPRMRDMLARHQHEFAMNCAETGFLPFAAFPERNTKTRLKILQSAGLDPARPTVVFTPSRKSIGSWDYLAERLINELSGAFNLVLRPHPSQAMTPRLDDRVQFRHIADLAAAAGHACLDRGEYVLADWLAAADLVISDANSPAEESMFYDLPQLLVETPAWSRDEMRTVLAREGVHAVEAEKVLGLYDCGPRLQAIAPVDLRQRVEMAIADSGSYAAQRQRYFAWVFGEGDRNAARRVATAVRGL